MDTQLKSRGLDVGLSPSGGGWIRLKGRLLDILGTPKTCVGALLETAAGHSGKTSPLNFDLTFLIYSNDKNIATGGRCQVE